MAENRESGIFQYTDKTNLSDVEEIREEKKVQEQLLEMMYMFQHYYGVIEENEYVLRESVLDCFYGTKYAKFDCKEDHGILKEKYPVMTTKDYLEENIHNFGSCLCPEKLYMGKLPMTRAVNENGQMAEKAACNEFPHICVPLVDIGQEWKQVDNDVVAEVTEKVYFPLLVERAVLVCQRGGLIFIREVPEVGLKSKKRGSRLVKLSPEYMKWFYQAEGTKFYPYRDLKDSDEAKEVKTVTISPGITFNINGLHWSELKEVLGWNDDEIRNIINSLFASDENIEDTEHDIGKEKAQEIFNLIKEDYIDLVNQAIIKYELEDDNADTNFSKQQLEAMFDYAYNSGLSSDYIEDSDRIIYYYLRYRPENDEILKQAVEKVKIHGNENNRRRINQMNLFFNESYEFIEYEDEMFKTIKGDLGF